MGSISSVVCLGFTLAAAVVVIVYAARLTSRRANEVREMRAHNASLAERQAEAAPVEWEITVGDTTPVTVRGLVERRPYKDLINVHTGVNYVD